MLFLKYEATPPDLCILLTRKNNFIMTGPSKELSSSEGTTPKFQSVIPNQIIQFPNTIQ